MASHPEIIEEPYAFQRLLGFEILDWTAAGVTLHLPVHEGLGNRYGLPHGGVYATILDAVMGFSGCFTGKAAEKRFAMTLSLTVNFVSRPKGRLLIAEGWKIGGGQRTFFAEGKVTDETGELLAKGNGTFRYRT